MVRFAPFQAMPLSELQAIDRSDHAAKAPRNAIAQTAARDTTARPYVSKATAASATRKSPPVYQLPGANPAPSGSHTAKTVTASAPTTNGGSNARLIRRAAA